MTNLVFRLRSAGPKVASLVGIRLRGARRECSDFDVVVRLKGSKTLAGIMKFRLGFLFRSKLKSDDPEFQSVFEVFSNTSLVLNSWPWAREFVASTAARMGWPAVTLPLFKVGTPGKRASRPTRSSRDVSEPSRLAASRRARSK